MHQLLLATRNSHKTREFAEILGDEFEVRDLADGAESPMVDETGLTFEENAILKAIETSKHFQELVVADDSGLEVDALQGAPGIHSARYAGENATDAANVAKLLAELMRCGPAPHSARFRCSLALARGGRILETFAGVVEGTIVIAPRGRAGFGYDPVFQPQGFEQTFAELSPAEKNQISHRAKAIRLLRAVLLAKSQGRE
jgi:XTP/dITP diphosphohydrolase